MGAMAEIARGGNPASRQRELELLAALLRENHVTVEDARHEAGTGPNAAQREELRIRANWKTKKKKGGNDGESKAERLAGDGRPQTERP